MELPGGILSNGTLRRDFAFQPLTGRMELAVAESAASSTVVPVRVTTAPSAALKHVGSLEPTWERIHQLSVGDRQHLVRQLAAHLGA